MPELTAAPATVRLDPLARERLTQLQRDLLHEGYWLRHNDLVSALVYGTTAPQAVGMGMAFVRSQHETDSHQEGPRR